MSHTFFSRLHALISFSRAIAASMFPNISKCTSRKIRYRDVNPGTSPWRCSAILRERLFVTPT